MVPLWFIISIIGAGVKLLVHMVAIAKDIGIRNYGVAHRNSDLLQDWLRQLFRLVWEVSDFCFIAGEFIDTVIDSREKYVMILG